MKKSTLLHLRIPFSYFLLPVFLFSVSINTNFNWQSLGLVFFILHILVYPASNGYNSYFDKDEKSIGGLRTPPKTSKELYYWALVLDLAGLILALLVGFWFTIAVLIYGLVSKAYSHPSIRIKKYPFLSWFIAGGFQGAFTFYMVYLGLHGPDLYVVANNEVLLGGLLSSLILWGSYPMTQIYQHEEDAKRGDRTLSLTLGIRGTFHFTAISFAIGSMGFLAYYQQYQDLQDGLWFLAFMLPVAFYFGSWYLKVNKDIHHADYDHTMRLNLISASCLNLFFLLESVHVF